MERRDLLKLLASTALPVLSADALLLLEDAHAEKSPILKTLNAHQNATVTTIAELIIPETKTPGAKAARVNEFIDLMLSEWYDAPDTAHFLAGLADVDARSRKLFGRRFVACSDADQKSLLTALDDEALAARSGVPSAAAPPHFFSTMKRLTLVGYYTSEIGFKDELHKSIVPPVHKGCAPLEETV